MRNRKLLIGVLLALASASLHAATGALSAEFLRCEYRVDPAGMDVRQPRLSWVLISEQRGQKQTGYRVLVASTPQLLAQNSADLWESGQVGSDQTVHVVYEGKPLGSRARAFWKVQVWDREGAASVWSRPASWTMGLLEQSDWKAQWIADAYSVAESGRVPEASRKPPNKDAPPPKALPATLVRKTFDLDAPIERATAYVTGLGLYELRLNGHRVGDQILAPEWTNYRKRIQYQTFEVTNLLQPGVNTVGAMLGEGWYAGRLMVVGSQAYGSYPRFLLQLEIELANGQTRRIVTDASWHSSNDGPIRHSGIYDGEEYDARKEMPGWDKAGFAESGWRPVQSFDLGAEQLVWQPNEPIRVVKELKPAQVTEPKPGVYVFDLGQNMVGWCRIKVQGKAGQAITIRHAEMLSDDGTIYTANLRGAPQKDRYVPRSDGEAVYEPNFTYHGFRYVELTGLAKPPGPDAVLGRVFHSSSPDAGQFESSSPLLNQLMQNIAWTQRGNLMSTPNDCPQRDERFGWMGDIQAFSQTALFNMDLAAFFTKWIRDIRDDQADDGRYPDFAPHPGNPNVHFSGVPAWGDAGTIVPWRMYQNCADTRLIAEHFESAHRWVDYIHQNNPDLIWAKGRHNNYNDWLNGDTLIMKDWPRKGGAVPPDVFATAFFAHSTDIVSKMARVLGQREEAKRYGDLFQQIKTAFQKRFVQPDGKMEGETQAGYALALHFDLLPEELRPRAAKHLLEGIQRYNGHLSTGIQTSHRALLELTRQGHHEEAWRLVNLRDFPSWGMMIDNGATTIWERWDGSVKGRGFQDPGMNSFNHWALGAVGEWVWRNIVGINPDETSPGYKHFVIRPRPAPGLTWAKGQYNSIRGRIVSEWKIQDGRLTLDVAVPPNCTATWHLPIRDPSSVQESGKPASVAEGVVYVGIEDGAGVYRLESGQYKFIVPFDSATPQTNPHSPR